MTTDRSKSASRARSLTEITDEVTAAELDAVSGGILGDQIRQVMGKQTQTPTETVTFTYGGLSVVYSQ